MRILAFAILGIIGVLSLLLGMVALAGSRLPVSHVATRSTWLPQPPQMVYALVRDFYNAPNWRSDITSVEMLDDTGETIRYREHGKHGDVTYEVVEDSAGQRLVTRIVDQDLGYSGSWTFEFVPENNGTRIRITENGEVTNVMFRFMSRYIFGHTSSIDEYLKALGKKFKQGAELRIED